MEVHERFGGYLTGPPEGEALCSAIGKLVVNCGSIELGVDLLLVALSPNPVNIPDVREKSLFSARAERLRRYASASAALDPRTRFALLETLDGLAALMNMRNDIAHGPLALHFRDGVPVAIGVLQLRERTAPDMHYLELAAIGNLVNLAHRGATLLEELRQSILAGRPKAAT